MKLRNNNRHRNSRQGITLLFVVSMIVLFLLMGTAFVVVSNDYFRASRSRAKAKLYTVDRTALVHRTFYNIIRGPELSNIFSPFRGHDLLSDQYGFGFKGFVNETYDDASPANQTSPVEVTGSQGQFVRIALASAIASAGGDTDNNAWSLHNPTNPNPTPLPAIGNLYNGLVLTFTSGPAQGLSTRIFSHVYEPNHPFADTAGPDGQHYFWITPVWLDRGGVAPADLLDSEVIINGREFSGIGAGEFIDEVNEYNGAMAADGLRDAARSLGPSSLRPNRVGESLADFRTNFLGSNVFGGAETGTPSRSVNEGYDAADFQNMFLSGRDDEGNLIPSYHRHSLYEYVYDAAYPTNADRLIRPRASFRPANYGDELNNFTGVQTPDGIPDPGSTANNNYPYNTNARNPASVTNPEDDFDCDTDFDGELDAVFIDPGYGIITNPDGTKYKPLVAIRVDDMDGNVNMNIHGNLTQRQADRFVDGPNRTAQYNGGTRFPRGSGYGPAEIDLTRFFENDYAAINSVLVTRYGADGVPGDGGTAGKAIGKLFGHPRDTVNITTGRYGTVDCAGGFPATLYGSSPMDLNGRFSIASPNVAAVDPLPAGGTIYSDFRDWNDSTFANGLPVIDMTVSGTALSEFANNPYEMTVAPLPFGDANDSPYSAIELERILRQFDMDAELLAGRLWNAPGASWDWDDAARAGIREQVTTESYEVPTIPETFRLVVVKRLTQIYRDRNPAFNRMQIEALVNGRIGGLFNRFLFAPELFNGLKMDVNRPFGNGYDDNNDGAVDNPAETVFGAAGPAKIEENWDYYNGPTNLDPAMDLDNDYLVGAGEVDTTAPIDPRAGVQDPRVRFARHLYMLALLMTDELGDVDLDGDGEVDANSHQRIIAQWAINVADFRDPDTIMTPFEFDLDPFDADGWNVDGDITTTGGEPDRFVVWGVERPELLLTETYAAHARRTEDLASDSSGETLNDTDGNGTTDDDFDQGLRPEPFAFIEVYNPWTQNRLNQRFDGTLYNNNGLQLDRVSLAANGAETPVWRFAIERERYDAGGTPLGTNRAMRYVYMTDPDVSGSDVIGDDNGGNVEVFFSSFDYPELPPGGQAVVGTLGIEDPDNAGEYKTYMGRLAGKTQADELTVGGLDMANTRSLTIVPDSDPANSVVKGFPSTPANTRNAIVVPIDQARVGTVGSTVRTRRFSVSDPLRLNASTDLTGYPEVDAMGTPGIPTEDGLRYTVPYDEPFDYPNSTDLNRSAEDLDELYGRDGMAKKFRVIKLQRLANPLMPWDATTNPYLTIDVMDMDLATINGVTAADESTTPLTVAVPPAPGFGTPSGGVNRAVALERGAQGLNEDTHNAEQRELWRSGRVATIAATAADATHYAAFEMDESFGKTNDSYVTVTGPAKPFSWLTWNNRPYVSHLEMTNVPLSSPEWLTRSFTTNDGTNPFVGALNTTRGRYQHLMNFFANDTDGGGTRTNIFRLMDYLEVPSRFLGTEERMNPAVIVNHPFNVVPRYRVPGKINLNTIYNDPGDADVSRIWDALQGDFTLPVATPLGLTWPDFRDSRNGTSTTLPTDFENPFRPAGAGRFVPELTDFGGGAGDLVVDDPQTTIFRANAAGTEPLFDFDDTTAAYDADRSAYFRNAQRQRLANMTTNRSSVFAIWVTVAYFEVDENGLVGAEVGVDTGESVRHRGFYIYDRSIPVGFEPGKNHNVERGILVQSIIE